MIAVGSGVAFFPTMRRFVPNIVIVLASLASPASGAADSATAVRVEGQVVDAATSRPVPARIYIRGSDGKWHFPQSASPTGSAIRYERQRANTASVEMHTTLSADPFWIELAPGKYAFTVERGKEFVPEIREVTVAPGTPKLTFRLRRWTDMAASGWYSGDTHVHREPAELASIMLAEDVNVATPLLDWTPDSRVAPSASARSLGARVGSAPVSIDATHVWHPRNTEYEISHTEGQRHWLGAFLILNHRTRFAHTLGALDAVLRQARAEGALIDLEKHNWPWSIAMVPVLKADLFELANNHHWRPEYAVKNWQVPAPAWMKLSGTGTDSERDWTLYGFETYYALLNCGFRLAPTAGTANGVHPVPLGFSRVYVQLEGGFSYEAWIGGLGAGRSFVTNGPMLRARAAGQWPGAGLAVTREAPALELRCTIESEQPLQSIELIVNGKIAQRFEPANRAEAGAFRNEIVTKHEPKGSGWFAWRCFEPRGDGRFRFAHTAPWHVNAPGEPLRPRREQADWLVARVKEEIDRSRGIAPPALMDAYQRALRTYEDLAARAR